LAKEVEMPNMPAANLPSIHIHINNHPLASTCTNRLTDTPRKGPGLKRQNPMPQTPSDSSGDDDFDPLPLSDILQDLHHKFPKLNFLQYSRVLEEKGIYYAQGVLDFDREYFVHLGFPEGAVGSFLSAVRRAIYRQQGSRKRVRVSLKENDA
jgi:hypothetical protein